MRWDQAKSLMILLFLLLNTVLGYYNFVRPYRVMAVHSENDAVYQMALKQLEALGVSLAEKPSVAPVSLASLQLQSGNGAEAVHDVATRYFGSVWAKVTGQCMQTLGGGQVWRFAYDQEILEVTSDGRYTYRLSSLSAPESSPISPPSSPPLTPDQAQALAELFLTQRGENLGDLHPLRTAATYQDTQQSGMTSLGDYRFTWCARYKGFPVYDAELSVVVRENRIVMANSTLRPIIGQTGSELWLNNANDILLRLRSDTRLKELAEQAETEGRTLVIQSVQLGYFAQNQTAAQAAETEVIPANPAWRVLLETGEALYYDALSSQRIYP